MADSRQGQPRVSIAELWSELLSSDLALAPITDLLDESERNDIALIGHPRRLGDSLHDHWGPRLWPEPELIDLDEPASARMSALPGQLGDLVEHPLEGPRFGSSPENATVLELGEAEEIDPRLGALVLRAELPTNALKPRLLECYMGGLRWGTVEIPFDQVIGVSFFTMRNRTAVLPILNSYHFRFWVGDEVRDLEFVRSWFSFRRERDEITQFFHWLVNFIDERVMCRLVDEMVATVMKGGDVAIGRLHIAQSGIGWGRKMARPVSWRDVAGARYTDSNVEVFKRGRRSRLGKVSMTEPNAVSLPVLLPIAAKMLFSLSGSVH